MYKVIIFTHDVLSRGLLETSRIVMGEQPDIETYSVTLGCDLEELRACVKNSIEHSEREGQEVLVLTDLMYGTPFNMMAELQETHCFSHITGVNLPMLLEAINRRQEPLSESTNGELVKAAKNSIFDCRKFLGAI